MGTNSAKQARPATVDEYLAAVGDEHDDRRVALERLRRTVMSAAPGIGEGMSYRLPSFRLGGRWILHIGAAARHCAIYGIANTDRAELAAYDTGAKGTIRFQPDEPLPDALVRKLVRERIAANSARKRRVSASGARDR